MRLIRLKLRFGAVDRVFSPLWSRALFWLAACAMRKRRRSSSYVNTLQGTNSTFELSRGNTFPATARPFGMHMWTPQTGRNGDGWKYQYARDTIRGFQQSHQCSPWSNDYAVFSLMPVVGPLVVNEDERAMRFRHADEVAKPHYLPR